MEPMVLRRPLMAKRRRIESSGRGPDCRTITIIFMFSIFLGMVIIINYPSKGHSKSGGPGLLANIQDQAKSWLGGQPKGGASQSVGLGKTEVQSAKLATWQKISSSDKESKKDADGFNFSDNGGLALDDEKTPRGDGALKLDAEEDVGTKRLKLGNEVSKSDSMSRAAGDEQPLRAPIRIHKVSVGDPGEVSLTSATKSRESSGQDASALFRKDLAVSNGYLNEDGLVHENSTAIKVTVGAGSPIGNQSCTSSACVTVPAINALLQDALNGSTLYIGPQPCRLFQQLNGSSLFGLEPSFQAIQEEEIGCETLPIKQVVPEELASVLELVNMSSFKLIVISDTLEKLSRADAKRVIAAVAEGAEGLVLVALGSVKSPYGSLKSATVEKRGLQVYESATFWLEAFAAEGLMETRDELPLLEKARGNVADGALLFLQSSGNRSSHMISQGKALPSGLPKSSTEEDDEDQRDAPSAAAKQETARRFSSSSLLSPVPSNARRLAPMSLGAPSPRGLIAPASPSRGVQEKEGGKPALGLSFFSQFFAPLRAQEGARLQAVLEEKALLQELESKEGDEDVVTLDGSETESGVTSMETAEDRKALNKRLPEVAKRATDSGAFRSRKALLKRRQR